MEQVSTFLGIATVSDSELWDRFRAGDQKSYEILYKRHFKILAQYGYKISGDPLLTEDAIQDVFIDLWRRRSFLSETKNPKFYLFKALRNQLIRNGRNDVFDKSNDIDEFLDYLVTLSEEQQLIEHETRTDQVKHIRKAISQLSPRQQEVITLRFYHGMSIHDISQLMTLSPQSVNNLLSRSYAVLRMIIHFLSMLIVNVTVF